MWQTQTWINVQNLITKLFFLKMHNVSGESQRINLSQCWPIKCFIYINARNQHWHTQNKQKSKYFYADFLHNIHIIRNRWRLFWQLWRLWYLDILYSGSKSCAWKHVYTYFCWIHWPSSSAVRWSQSFWKL